MSSLFSFCFGSLFSRKNRASLIILSVFFYIGIALGITPFFGNTIESAAFSVSGIMSRLILLYFLLTALFILGSSQVGFIVIPVFFAALGLLMSFVVRCSAEDVLNISAVILPYLSLASVACLFYGSVCMKLSHELYQSSCESRPVLQDSIKLYCFTLAVFTLLTLLFAGVGYIISWVYRLFF